MRTSAANNEAPIATVKELPRYTVRIALGTAVEAFMHILILGVLYFLPAIIAATRHTHNCVGILLLNFFLGWTGVGWFVALLMALLSAPRWVYYYHRGW